MKIDSQDRVRRKLRFPLNSQNTFYLDISSASTRGKVVKRIEDLNGKVEEFLSKDVTLVITDRKTEDKKQAQQIHKQNLPMSRGQALLMKATKSEKINCDVLQNAETLGVKVQKAADFMKDTYKLCSKQKKSKNEEAEGIIPLTWNDKENEPVLKCEDQEHLYKPVIKFFDALPLLRYDADLVSPFDRNVVLCRKVKDNVNRYSVKGKSQPNTRKGGFCEACDYWYKCSLRQHLNSDRHQKFVKDSFNFQKLDDIIKKLPSLSNFTKRFSLQLQKSEGESFVKKVILTSSKTNENTKKEENVTCEEKDSCSVDLENGIRIGSNSHTNQETSGKSSFDQQYPLVVPLDKTYKIITGDSGIVSVSNTCENLSEKDLKNVKEMEDKNQCQSCPRINNEEAELCHQDERSVCFDITEDNPTTKEMNVANDEKLSENQASAKKDIYFSPVYSPASTFSDHCSFKELADKWITDFSLENNEFSENELPCGNLWNQNSTYLIKSGSKVFHSGSKSGKALKSSEDNDKTSSNRNYQISQNDIHVQASQSLTTSDVETTSVDSTSSVNTISGTSASLDSATTATVSSNSVEIESYSVSRVLSPKSNKAASTSCTETKESTSSFQICLSNDHQPDIKVKGKVSRRLTYSPCMSHNSYPVFSQQYETEKVNLNSDVELNNNSHNCIPHKENHFNSKEEQQPIKIRISLNGVKANPEVQVLKPLKQRNKQTLLKSTSGIYCAVQQSDMKLKLCKVKVTPVQQNGDLRKYWNVRKSGGCRLVFSSEKRKANDDSVDRDHKRKRFCDQIF